MGLFWKLSNISRRRKLELFDKVMMPTQHMRVLDVGSETDLSGARRQQFIDFYPWKHRVSAINLASEHISAIKRIYPEVEAVVGDACKLPWPDKHFDVVYSNAVIEHLGNLAKQEKMAAEIMRVGKRWFVTTPNRWYPFEFHMRLPFVTLLPGNGYLWASRIVTYNHVKRKYTFGNKMPDSLRASNKTGFEGSSNILKYNLLKGKLRESQVDAHNELATYETDKATKRYAQ